MYKTAIKVHVGWVIDGDSEGPPVTCNCTGSDDLDKYALGKLFQTESW